MTTTTFKLEEVSCPSCVKNIEKATGRLEGVSKTKVLFNSGKVKTTYDEQKLDPNVIEDTINKLGYQVVSYH